MGDKRIWIFIEEAEPKERSRKPRTDSILEKLALNFSVQQNFEYDIEQCYLVVINLQKCSPVNHFSQLACPYVVHVDSGLSQWLALTKRVNRKRRCDYLSLSCKKAWRVFLRALRPHVRIRSTSLGRPQRPWREQAKTALHGQGGEQLSWHASATSRRCHSQLPSYCSHRRENSETHRAMNDNEVIIFGHWVLGWFYMQQ